MSESPLGQFLQAIDRFDVEAVIGLLAPDVRLLLEDGRRAEGTPTVRETLRAFFGMLRSTTHRITAEWHVDDVWIAEVEASYVLQDLVEINGLPRAFVLREGPEGITDAHIYGAHERPLSDHRTGEEGMRIGGRCLPPL